MDRQQMENVFDMVTYAMFREYSKGKGREDQSFRVMDNYAKLLYEDIFAEKLPIENLLWLIGFLMEHAKNNLDAQLNSVGDLIGRPQRYRIVSVGGLSGHKDAEAFLKFLMGLEEKN
jgi:hypothetical protein